MIIKEMRCETCLYFKPAEERPPVSIGACQRYPPVIVGQLAERGVDYASRFPLVGPDCFCGEFKAK